MPVGAYELVVDEITVPPRNGDGHPWRATRRHGVVTVERSPGLAAAQSSRARTPEEAAARDAAVSAEEGSASEVGDRLGLSRSAVLGCRYRHRERSVQPECVVVRAPRPSRRVGPIPAPVERRPTRSTRPRVAPEPVPEPILAFANVPPEPVPGVPAARVSLLDVGFWQCRAIDGADGLCCGASTSGTSPWCAVHRLVYTRRDDVRRRVA